MIRSTGGIYDVYDSARYTAITMMYMQWSTDSAETTGYFIDFANGFKIRTSGTGINKKVRLFIMQFGAMWFKYNNTLP